MTPDWMRFNVFYPHDQMAEHEPSISAIEVAAAAIYARVHNYPACTATQPWTVFREKYEQRAEEYMKNARVALLAARAAFNLEQKP